MVARNLARNSGGVALAPGVSAALLASVPGRSGHDAHDEKNQC